MFTFKWNRPLIIELYLLCYSQEAVMRFRKHDAQTLLASNHVTVYKKKISSENCISNCYLSSYEEMYDVSYVLCI